MALEGIAREFAPMTFLEWVGTGNRQDAQFTAPASAVYVLEQDGKAVEDPFANFHLGVPNR